MTRVPDWPERLAEAVYAARHEPFVWGAHDCAIWTFDAVAEMTGTASHADAWRGRYSTALGSERIMRKLGWQTMEEAVTALLGDPIPPLMAQRGDLVMAAGSVGLCIGPWAQMIGEYGPDTILMADADAAWRIG